MTETTDRTFDRIKEFDEKSRNFPVTAGISTYPLRSYTWSCDAWNDQGQEGACVGFAWSHELAARPYPVPTAATVAREIYLRAQQIDEWPGEAYEGTSVLAGAKATKERLNAQGNAYMQEYRWAFGIGDLLLALGYKGPAVLGVNWYTGMYDTDAQGFIRKTGSIAGGHAILARGAKIVLLDKYKPRTYANIDTQKSFVLLRNSWGKDWGVTGDAKITVADLDSLLREGGDACVPTLRRK